MGRMEQNMSRIEQLITEIEEYIDSCKPQPFSTTKIIVDKGTLEELLVELRHRTPDEIKKYQKILSNKEAIIADAKAQAESMIASATEQTQELINEHEIMQQAYKKANEIIERATAQAQMIVDQAAADANELRESGVDYVEDMLKNMEALVSHTVENTSARYNSFLTSLNSTAEIIRSNLEELHPTASQASEETAAPEDVEAATTEK